MRGVKNANRVSSHPQLMQQSISCLVFSFLLSRLSVMAASLALLSSLPRMDSAFHPAQDPKREAPPFPPLPSPFLPSFAQRLFPSVLDFGFHRQLHDYLLWLALIRRVYDLWVPCWCRW